jgi:hypothetical protein
MCYQGDVLVYGEAGSPDHAFQLGGASSDWLRNKGAANCKADLMDAQVDALRRSRLTTVDTPATERARRLPGPLLRPWVGR